MIYPGLATQAICPNPEPVPLQELTGPAVLASPFRPIIQSRQESYVLYELCMPFNIMHLCRGLESSCYYLENSGTVAFCVSPTSLFCGAPGEPSAPGQHHFQVRLGSRCLCQVLQVQGPHTILRALKREKRKKAAGCTDWGSQVWITQVTAWSSPPLSACPHPEWVLWSTSGLRRHGEEGHWPLSFPLGGPNSSCEMRIPSCYEFFRLSCLH